ncbi:MAG: hypothetical protein DME19_06895 [Verrucomicrobia bacterium]|nr:MAG: hypothetical protein DME19_06895 [Verrucomicrobiota bacterium]
MPRKPKCRLRSPVAWPIRLPGSQNRRGPGGNVGSRAVNQSMICAEDVVTRPVRLGRSEMARSRVEAARAALAECHLCAHHCGVNRLAGERGLCHAGVETRVFMAQVEVSDELELIPTFAIALSGCDLRCSFCITGAESWNPQAGEPLDAVALAAKAQAALDEGARTVMILGGEPTVHLPSVLEIVAELPDNAKLVWKTNAHGSAQARELLDGLFDVWLADYKFGNDACALRLAREHSELIVRHLVMPDHVDCCWAQVARWLDENLPGIKVNLRSGFWPGWRSARHGELRRTVAIAESESAGRIARECRLNLVR